MFGKRSLSAWDNLPMRFSGGLSIWSQKLFHWRNYLSRSAEAGKSDSQNSRSAAPARTSSPLMVLTFEATRPKIWHIFLFYREPSMQGFFEIVDKRNHDVPSEKVNRSLTWRITSMLLYLQEAWQGRRCPDGFSHALSLLEPDAFFAGLQDWVQQKATFVG